MRRLLAVLLAAGVLTTIGALGVAGRDAPSPAAAPAAPAAAVDAVRGDDLPEVVAGLQQRLRDVPGDWTSWAALALAQVELARTTGDATLYDRAEQAVERSLAEQPDDNALALSARAALLAARHDFGAALDASEAALAVDPYQPTALVTRVDALTELGEYDAQLAALRRADRLQPGVPVATRYAYAFELRGRLDDAAALLRRTLTGAASAAERSFVLTTLADVERRRGRLDAAERAATEAVRLDPAYVPAAVSLARLATARNDLDAAVEAWTGIVARLPLTDHLVELAELHLARGDEAAAAQQLAVVRASEALQEQGGVDVDLESAFFEADHGDAAAALAKARAVWDAGRRSLHAADALGWALHATGADRAALPLLRRATALGPAEARPWLHRGLVEAALGLDQAARRSLERGLATDPGTSPWQVRRAERTLAAIEGRR